ncbi:MAG: hypothetical protein RBR28_13520 [Lentimicrobium sp.]|jgi:hypothetical protein|nr:hypothetical protein [Lentimicrobium sp.]
MKNLGIDTFLTKRIFKSLHPETVSSETMPVVFLPPFYFSLLPVFSLVFTALLHSFVSRIREFADFFQYQLKRLIASDSNIIISNVKSHGYTRQKGGKGQQLNFLLELF